MNQSQSPFAAAYPWDYLKPENSDRPAILESLVGPYIEGRETVLDLLCGFSPLSRFLLRRECRVLAFDKSEEAIAYCRRAYPSGRYDVAADSTVNIPRDVDVVLHLGIAPGTDPWGLESRTEVETSKRAILANLPRLIILETAVGYAAGYEALKAFAESLTGYRLEKEEKYTFHPAAASINPGAPTAYERVLCVFQKVGTFFSLSDRTLGRFLAELDPSSQAQSASDLNLGFGFLYYGMARVLRPKLALVLGSKLGFSPISIALAIRDNANGGRLLLVDAGYSDTEDGTRGMGGIGFWRDSGAVESLLRQFGVADIMEVHVMRTSEFAELYRARRMPAVDLLLIDADHSYKGFKTDFETYSEFVRDDGVILCHDTEVKKGFAGLPFGVSKYMRRRVLQQPRRFQAISLPVWPGLGIVRKSGGPVRGVPESTRRESLQRAKAYLWKSARTAYHRVPLPQGLRLRLKSLFFTTYGRAFPKSSHWRTYLEARKQEQERKP